MMKRISFTHTAFALAMTTCVTCGSALADTAIMGGKAIVKGEVNAGFQQKIIDGAEEKFEEYRDVEEGVVLNDLRLKVDGVDTPYYLDLRVKDVGQDDEFYGLKGGSHGKYNFGVSYDSIPHNFSSGKLILNDLGRGRFAIGDVVQQQLQTPANEVLRGERLTYNPVTGAPLGVANTAAGAFINPADAQNMALDAGMLGIVSSLYGSADTVKYALKRGKTGFNFDYRLPGDVKVWAKVGNEKRSGTRRINQGTYERYNNGANGLPHVADFFVVAGVELPEAIEYRTTTMSVGTGVYKKNWLVDVEYSFTNFENLVNSMVWDNPFRLTSAPATTATGGSGNPFNRGRSALGQITLSPDSRSHDLAASGSVELPMHGRFSGNIGYGWVSQDDSFDPYTLNSGIVASNVPGTPAAIGLALPQGDLDGKVATMFQSYQLSVKPLEPLALTARYRYYDYDNKSDHITFPGYAAFGDSFWRTEKNDVSGGQDAPVRNEALSYTRQNAELGIDFHVLKPLTVIVEGFWEDWDREELRIDDTTEFGAGGGIVYKPTRYAKVKGNYRYSHRTVEGYEPGNTPQNPEAPGLVNYDWADRFRHKADLRLQMAPIEPVTVGLSGQYQNDRFGRDSRFGLKRNESMTGAVDVGYAVSETVSLNANYAKEFRKGFMQSGAKDDSFDIPGTPLNEAPIGNFNPANYWNTDIYEKVDTVGLGAAYQVIPARLTLTVGYNFSYSKMDFNTYNPNGPVKLLNAAAQPWPTVINRYQEVKTDIAYNFTKNLKTGVTYMYELFMQNDFANTPEYMAGFSAENSTRYLFTGANNFSYDAHVVGAYVNYKF